MRYTCTYLCWICLCSLSFVNSDNDRGLKYSPRWTTGYSWLLPPSVVLYLAVIFKRPHTTQSIKHLTHIKHTTHKQQTKQSTLRSDVFRGWCCHSSYTVSIPPLWIKQRPAPWQETTVEMIADVHAHILLCVFQRRPLQLHIYIFCLFELQHGGTISFYHIDYVRF